ncbi:MAG: aldehyde dehydrogenase family protein [Oscillospiraceae bacterium]|nr:aldehyde dehydrogenase family protein [Oscillospiraceae bacterium]
MWTQERIQDLATRQRRFFRSGGTLDLDWRIQQLRRLKQAVLAHRDEITAALAADLGRSEMESDLCDIGQVIAEINENMHGLRRWAKPELHFSGLACFPSTVTRVYKMPYGLCLIISPFNFPFLLSLGVLAAAIAGGNTAILKASSKSAHCTEVLKHLIADTFPDHYVALVDGGHETADLLLQTRFDKIFYTGSPKVGVHVMEAAARHLTPVTLELGGETGNWAVIRKDADLHDAARKLVFFKLLNSGQICINVNQVAVAEEVALPFLKELKAELRRQIGSDPIHCPEYPCLITQAAWDRCAAEAEQYRERILVGGQGDRERRKYAPTVIYPVRIDEPIVQHELFSPLLPIVPYKDRDIDALLETIAEREHGLALYLFTKDIAWARQVMATQQYGGGCVNEVCVHQTVKGAPFGGVGHSGMGAYHGLWGFREFTHPSTVLFGRTHGNLSLREHPYTGAKGALKQKLLKLLER